MWTALNKSVPTLTSIAALVGILWFVAKPHAENFIQDTVDDRITKIEQGVKDVTGKVESQSEDIGEIKTILKGLRDDLERARD